MSRDDRPDRPLYVGNFEYDAQEREIKRLVDKYGDVDRIDMKTGFAFVYMRRKDDGDYVIRKLDNMEFGYKRRRLRVEWAKQANNDRQREAKPSCTLFVVNFDVAKVRVKDVEKHFDSYGRLKRVEIKRNYAFVQYDNVEDAKYALEKTNGTSLLGRTITVEYCQNEDPYKDGDRSRSPRRSRSRSRGRSYSRSKSPADRRRSYSRSRSRSR